jgi:hypothetical protein
MRFLNPDGGARSLVLRRREASWIIPLDSRPIAASGFCIYRPKSSGETVVWYAARWAASPRLFGRRACDGVSFRGDLAAAVSRELGYPDLRFAVAVPEPDRATVAAIIPSGEIVAFGKLAASEAAIARIEREHTALRRIRPQLPPSVHAPKLLFRGVLCGVEALLVSPVNGSRAAVSGRLRGDYLRALVALVRPSGEKQLAALLPSPTPLGDEWASLLSTASTRLIPWTEVLVRPALVHGDFAPWNLVPRRCGVAAYDWEDALEEGAPFWDLWHFATQSAALLHRWSQRELVQAATHLRGPLGRSVRTYARAAALPTELAPAVLTAYLAASGVVVGRHGGLDRPDRVESLRYRAGALAGLLEAWQ